MTVATAGITATEVHASVRRVIDHAESVWDEWAWQVENQTWAVIGYASWDEMRRGEYGALTSIAAPRAERPELVARFRGAGLTQRETATTLGVTIKTIKRDEHPEWRGTNVPSSPVTQTHNSPADIVDAEIVEDFCTTCGGDQGSCDCRKPVPVATGPKATPRKPLPDQFRDRLYDLTLKVESLHRLVADDRWTQNAEKLAATKNRNELLRLNDLLTQVIDSLPAQEPTNA